MADNIPAAAAATLSPFIEFLQSAEGGELLKSLDENFLAVTTGLRERANPRTGNASGGKLSLSLSVSLADGMVGVLGEPKMSLPAIPRRKSLFHMRSDGSLSRTDPRQYDIEQVRPQAPAQAADIRQEPVAEAPTLRIENAADDKVVNLRAG